MKLKNVILAIATLAGVAAAGSANAGQVFTANPNNLGYPAPVSFSGPLPASSFQSDLINGSYQEYVTLTPTSASSGTFSFSILWQGQGFQLSGNPLGSLTTGLTTTYEMFSTYYGTGTYAANGSGGLNFNPSSGGALQMSITGGTNLSFTNTTNTGAGTWTPTSSEPIVVLANAVGTIGEGTTKNCVAAGTTDCGSFGANANLTLTTQGKEFFTAPVPFYNVVFNAGNFNAYYNLLGGSVGPAGITTSLGGQLQVTFNNAVPEPTGLALVGVALFGLGIARRNRRA